MTSYLRCCAGCSGSFAADNRPGSYFCPACTTKNEAAFDPQPGDRVKEAYAPSAYQSTVIDPYRPTYVILARDGDDVTLRKLGFPDSPSLARSVAHLDAATLVKGARQ